jgi:hypothetical protein
MKGYSGGVFVVVIAGYALFVSIPWLENGFGECGAAAMGGAMLLAPSCHAGVMHKKLLSLWRSVC